MSRNQDCLKNDPDDTLVTLLELWEQAIASGDSRSPRELFRGHSFVNERPERLDQLCEMIADLACFESFSRSSLPRIPGYAITDELGRGGMGVVYRAVEENSPSERIVAIKVLSHGRFASHDQKARFLREVALVETLKGHTGIVQVFRYGEVDGLSYVVMEYLDGGTLSARWQCVPQEQKAVAELVLVVAQIIADAHGKGVVHRDLKPSNVLFNAHDQCKVADFGLAKSLHDSSTMTETGMPIGTPEYMSPEQLHGTADERSDVYSLGAVLYQGLTGSPPFVADSRPRLFEKIERIDPVQPRKLQMRVHRDLDAICLKCLEKSPAKRYGSAKHLVDDLRRFLDGRPVSARPINSLQRTARWCRRNPKLSIMSGSMALLLVAVAIVSTAWAFSLKRERDNLGFARGTLKTVSDTLANDRQFREAQEYRELHLNLLNASISIWESLLRQKPNDPSLQAELARGYWRLSGVFHGMAMQQEDHQQRESREKALQALDHASILFETVLERDPGDAESRFNVGWSRGWRSYFLLNMGDSLASAEQDCDQAISILEKLVDEFPAKLLWRVKLGACYELRGELASAGGDHDVALTWYERSVRPLAAPTGDSDLESDRQFWLSRVCEKQIAALRPAAAILSLKALRDQNPNDPGRSYDLALAQLWNGDEAGYRETCVGVMNWHGTTDDPHVAERIAYTCVVLPGAVRDMAALNRLAQVSLKRWEGHVRVLGAAQYRAGDYKNASASFDKHQVDRRAWDWLFLAMINHHLGESGEAKQCLEKGIGWIDKAQSGEKSHRWGWTEQIESLTLRKEAEALIQVR